MSIFNPSWQAARAGMPGDSNATNHATQISQFLATHGVTPVYAGNQIVTPLGYCGPSNPINWVNLGTFDMDQPFAMPAGATAIGRVTLPLTPVGAGADVTVSLCADSGGSPGTAITSTRIPASWLTQLAAAGGLSAAGPLGTALSNSVVFGPVTNTAWSQPAVSANGSGTYACPVTSGSYTILLGGWDSTANAAATTVATIQYQGGQAVSGPVPQPPLPKGAWFAMAAATASTVIFAGGINGLANLANVWTASWDPDTGSISAWTAQTALPNPVINGGMATWGDFVYVVGGNTANTSASATAGTWYASAVNGQIQSWLPGPSLPAAITNPYVAVVGNWLIAAGGLNSSGTALTGCYYTAINADGSPGPWKAGPSLPVQGYAFSPGWNLMAADSAMVIVSGPQTSSSSVSSYTQALTVSADGPALTWRQEYANVSVLGEFQMAYYQSGNPGEWMTFALHLTNYDATAMDPMPVISVPLPASGLTAGATYHLVLHQDGGDLNDYVLTPLLPNGEAMAAQTRPATGGAWTPQPSVYSMLAGVWDQAPAGSLLHLQEDAAAKVTSLIPAAASNQLLGVCEATAFPDGTLVSSVTEVTYSGALPVSAVQLA